MRNLEVFLHYTNDFIQIFNSHHQILGKIPDFLSFISRHLFLINLKLITSNKKKYKCQLSDIVKKSQSCIDHALLKVINTNRNPWMNVYTSQYYIP